MEFKGWDWRKRLIVEIGIYCELGRSFSMKKKHKCLLIVIFYLIYKAKFYSTIFFGRFILKPFGLYILMFTIKYIFEITIIYYLSLGFLSCEVKIIGNEITWQKGKLPY